MNIVTLDFESYWSTTHTLSKMNSIDYVMHPETEIISNSLKVNDGQTQCVFGEAAVRDQLNSVNWDDAFLIGHNMSGFDSMIAAWRFGIRPKVWGCTLAMARPIHGKTIGVSLAKLVAHYKIGVKNNAALINTRGKHLKDFTVAELNAMRIYNNDDTDQCFELFKRLKPHFSTAELWHLDSKIRALVEPSIMVDVPMLEAALAQERKNKRQTLLTLASMFEKQVMPLGDIAGADEDYLIERVRATMASAPMFSAVLEARGVPVPMKESPTVIGADGNPTLVPALAKTDLGFLALQDHDDELVALAAATRLSVKSTIAETRMEAFVKVAGYTGGKWPVTVNYCGADTTGRSSGWMYNPLNLPRIDARKSKPADALRLGLMAPPGHVIVAVDASGIEMRFNHFLWNVKYSTELWRRQPDADIYKPTAANFFGIDVKDISKDQRQVGKVQQLACGFQCGALTYIDMARTMGGLRLTFEESQAQVQNWRALTPEIADYKDGGWQQCQQSLTAIINEMEVPIDPRGIFTTCSEGIRLPSGRLIRYPSLRVQRSMRKNPRTGKLEDTEAFVYGEGRHKVFIYGGKVDENIVQAGARDVVFDVALEVFKRTKRRPALEVYDELVYVVPEDEAEQHLAIVQEEMRRPPSWFPDIVLWSEGDIAQRYGEAH